ncbi:MAG TPA: DUF3368 domain-containing protein [Prosthecobacter sp.]
MSIVVCNTTPVINFAETGFLHVLRGLFGQIVLPSAVVSELRVKEVRFPSVSAALQDSLFKQRQPDSSASGPAFLPNVIHPGEAECIRLGIQNPGALLILDDVEAREWALANGLNVIGTLGCLLVAKDKGLVAAIGPLLDELQAKARFWIAAPLRSHVLKRAGEL